MNQLTLPPILITMIIGTLITVTSDHWFVAWAGLELNTLAFLPILMNKADPRAAEATAKYFLAQAAAAAFVLFAAAMNAWYSGIWEIRHTLHPFNSVLFTLALAFKMGLAPLHLWMPEVLQGVNLPTGLILCTWQKIAPFYLMMQLHFFMPIAITLGFVSTFVGGWAGLDQTQLRKLLAYSSISHLGWMLIVMQFSPLVSLIVLAVYLAMTAAIFLALALTNSTSINMLATKSMKSVMISITMPLVLLSLGGLPPLTGFLPKWLIIHELIGQSASLTAALLIPPALLNLYFYLRISYVTALSLVPNNLTGTTAWRFQESKASLPLTICVTASLMVLPMAPAIVMFF